MSSLSPKLAPTSRRVAENQGKSSRFYCVPSVSARLAKLPDMHMGAGLWRACGALLFALVGVGACKREAPSGTTTPTAETPQASAAQQAKPGVTVVLAFGSEKKSWLTDAIQRFNAKA